MEGEPASGENLEEEALQLSKMVAAAVEELRKGSSQQVAINARWPLTTGDIHAHKFGLPGPSDILAGEYDSSVG